MKLIDFLGWTNNNGLYRNEVNRELYRVINNTLEVYNPDRLEWEKSVITINEYVKLQFVKQTGEWIEGFEIHNADEWQLVKTYYLQNGYAMSEGVVFSADGYIENNVVFYVWPQYGEIQITTNKERAKRNLVLKPIDWEPKFYAKYAGKAKFYGEMYWRIEVNRWEVSLIGKENVVNWNSMSMLGTLRDWKRCGITEEDAVFIPVENYKRMIVLSR